MDVTFEMNLDIIDIRRQGYDLLEFLSDIGGIQGLLVSGFAFLVSVWNYNMFDNNMVCNLYKLERASDTDTRHLKDTFKESDYMKPRPLYNPKDYFRDTLPSWICFCKSCKPDRLERGFEKARERMQRETNIIEIVKSRRYFNAALRFLLTKKQRMRIKERGRYTVINPDGGGERVRVQKGDEENEYTDGFYTSDSDAFVPDDAGGGQESQLVEAHATTLTVNQTLFAQGANNTQNSESGLMNPEKFARIALAKEKKKQLRLQVLSSSLVGDNNDLELKLHINDIFKSRNDLKITQNTQEEVKMPFPGTEPDIAYSSMESKEMTKVLKDDDIGKARGQAL